MIHSQRRRIGRVVGRLLSSAVLVVPLLLVVAPSPASAVVCGQFSHAWVATTGQGSVFGGSTLTVDENTSLFPTGVIAPFQAVSFVFVNNQTGAVHQHITHQARENCVVHHEPEETRAGDIGIGTFRVTADYLRWEDLTFAHDFVGTLVVRQYTGGGGGGGGGCQPGMICEL